MMTQQVKPPISDEEKERRRAIVREADASNRIEGLYRDPASDIVFEAYINGEIEVDEMVPRLKAMAP